MQAPWKKMENDKGYPVYYNENTQQKQWDHPDFIEIKQGLDECNYVKYSKYRVALKFRTLQKALFMEEIALTTILGVFHKHKLGINESSLCLDSYDLEAVLYDIYFAGSKLNGKPFNVDHAVELMQNFLYNVYDKERQGTIQVNATKLALALLSDSDLLEFNKFIFAQCSDHNNCVTRLRLQALLLKLTEIFIFFHEDVSFGQHLVYSSIESCFINSPGLVGVSENNFISWLEEDPQLTAWIPILHKMKTCETVVHNTRCTTCGTNPLFGFLYKCMKCSKYVQCQRCFLTGRVNNSHKLSHSMKEFYTTEGTTRQFNFRFIKKLCGLVQCPQGMDDTSSSVLTTNCLSLNQTFVLNTNKTPLKTDNDPQAQLHLIIKQLEEQNREIHKIVFGSYNEKEIKKHLQEHKNEVSAQIKKLKILRESLHHVPPKNLVQSTPMLGNPNKVKLELGNMLSPIIQPSEEDQSRNPNYNNTEGFTEIYSVNDISTWIKDQPTTSGGGMVRKSPVREMHNDLDDALAKLQQILANNFSLDESLAAIDNDHLKHAVSEVEGMLTSFIDNVESTRASFIQPIK